MHTWGPIFLYLLVVVWTGLAVMPLCRAVFGDVRRIPLFSISLTCGFPLALLLFSLLARVNPNYEISVPLTLLLVTLTGGLGWSFKMRKGLWDQRSDILYIGVAVTVFLLLLLIRTNWPAIHWEGSSLRHGSEKLFNFTMQQSFLYGHGYPPENLWLAGETINYYLLPRGLPGLVAWGWRIMTGDAGVGGVLFIFSDSFFLMFASFSVAVWGHALLAAIESSYTLKNLRSAAVLLGIGTLISTHIAAIISVVNAFLTDNSIYWPELQHGAVPFNFSYYPISLLVLGDHHSHLDSLFLQITFLANMLLVFMAKKISFSRMFLSASLAAVLLLSSTGSVLLAVVVLVPATLGVTIRHLYCHEWQALRIFLTNLMGVCLIGLPLCLPALPKDQGQVLKWFWVPTDRASPFVGFIENHVFLVLPLIIATLGMLSLSQLRDFKVISWKSSGYSRSMQIIVFFIGVMLLLGEGGIAFAIICAGLTLLYASWDSPTTNARSNSRACLIIFAVALYLSWVFPELLVVNASDLPYDWFRFNVTLRFWLESYYIIPLFGVLVWAPQLKRIFEHPVRSRWVFGAGSIIVLLWVTVHVYSIGNRLRGVIEQPGMDGTAFLSKEVPCDSSIVKYLQSIDEPVRIGELCGTGSIIREVSTNYSWPGRIAAYSGRPGVCGWTLTTSRLTPVLNQDSPAKLPVWDRFGQYERNMQQAFVAAQNGSPASASRGFLDSLEVTHVIVGEQELRIFPGASSAALAKALGGIVDYSGENGCGVVRLNTDTKMAQQYFDQAFTLYQAGKFKASIDVSMQSLRLRPGYANTYNLICVDYNNLRQWGEAIQACEKAIELSPDYVLAKNNLAFAKEQLKAAIPNGQ